MLQSLSFDEYTELARQNKPIAVFAEISTDRHTPVSVFRALNKDKTASVLLESGLKQTDVGRFSYLGFDPIARFSTQDGQTSMTHWGRTEILTGDAFNHLRVLLAQMRCAFSARLPPLAAGAFGFISYDAVRLLEDIPNQHPDLDSLPDILFQFYETSLVFNHFKETITISVIVDPGTNLKESFYTAKSRLESIIAQISEIPIDEHLHFPPLPVQSDLSDEDFSRIVDQAKKHLLLGDVFRIVLSRKFAQPVSTTPIEIYRILRRLNPAPFLYYFQEKDYAIIGASFERLARLQNGIVDTMPIAPANPTERELREHVMQVDLARSDIGKVCQPGSVLVNEFKATKPFGDRNFLVSTIEGTLKANVDAIDVLKAVFPSGSLSGVPKIRAMEIIDALETSRRGLYGGAICMIDSMGNLDSCLATGTAIIKNGVATIRAGTGVLLDSDTDAKTQKTLHQAKGMLEAVRLAEEVIR